MRMNTTKLSPQTRPAAESQLTENGVSDCGVTPSRGGEIGKHRGLKIPRLKGLPGSSPGPGILLCPRDHPPKRTGTSNVPPRVERTRTVPSTAPPGATRTRNVASRDSPGWVKPP